jgi:ABC-type multidrug transport system permease subunit
MWFFSNWDTYGSRSIMLWWDTLWFILKSTLSQPWSSGMTYLPPFIQALFEIWLFTLNSCTSFISNFLAKLKSQLKDIYGLGAQLLVMIMMTCGIDLPEDLLILYRSGIFAIVNFQTCPRHRDDLEVYWKRQKRTYRSHFYLLQL